MKKIFIVIFSISLISYVICMGFSDLELGGYFALVFYPIFIVSLIIFLIILGIIYFRQKKFPIRIFYNGGIVFSAILLLFTIFGGGIEIGRFFLAQWTNNLSLCDNSYSPGWCMDKVINENTSANECKTFEDKEYNESLHECYAFVALRKNDAKVCQLILGSPEKYNPGWEQNRFERCILSLALKNLNIEMCKSLSEEKNLCLISLSILSNNKGLCLETIPTLAKETSYEAADCLYFFAIKDLDDNLCSQIKGSDYRRNECFDDLRQIKEHDLPLDPNGGPGETFNSAEKFQQYLLDAEIRLLGNLRIK